MESLHFYAHNTQNIQVTAYPFQNTILEALLKHVMIFKTYTLSHNFCNIL